MALTETDQALIKAAAKPYRERGAEGLALQAITGLSAARTYQRLNQLIDDPAAWAAEPVALGVLERRRASRSRLRSGRGQLRDIA